MKIFTKILCVILVFTTLIPLIVGMLCLCDPPGALEFFGLKSLTSESKKVLIVLGGFVLASAVLPIIAVIWLIKGKAEGITMAYIVGCIGVIRGLLMLLEFNINNSADATLSFTPIVIGVIILLFTFFAGRQHTQQI